ncbi:hypothetical protein N658DRAFT_489897 [Parathielavia hyrcaniae]|uniref:Uncharacterized protein n=1 Tax=Parathielavia hyrcaniae TaxID=113614 RepID=A0AAN6PRS8_9PEZI|nr:hypothetical protein N658DRAFT_489897 [Parathielavia hyrcaniae]
MLSKRKGSHNATTRPHSKRRHRRETYGGGSRTTSADCQPAHNWSHSLMKPESNWNTTVLTLDDENITIESTRKIIPNSRAALSVDNQEALILDSIEFDQALVSEPCSSSPKTPPPSSPFLPKCPFEREGAPSPERLPYQPLQIPVPQVTTSPDPLNLSLGDNHYKPNRKRRRSSDVSLGCLTSSSALKRQKQSPSEKRGSTWRIIPDYQAPATKRRRSSRGQSPKGSSRWPLIEQEPAYVPPGPDFSSKQDSHLKTEEAKIYGPNEDRSDGEDSSNSEAEKSSSNWSTEAVHGSVRENHGQSLEEQSLEEQSLEEQSNTDVGAPARMPPMQQPRAPSLSSPIHWFELFRNADENTVSQENEMLRAENSDDDIQRCDASNPSLKSPRSSITASDESS